MKEATFKPQINHSTNPNSKISSKPLLLAVESGEEGVEQKFNSQ